MMNLGANYMKDKDEQQKNQNNSNLNIYGGNVQFNNIDEKDITNIDLTHETNINYNFYGGNQTGNFGNNNFTVINIEKNEEVFVENTDYDTQNNVDIDEINNEIDDDIHSHITLISLDDFEFIFACSLIIVGIFIIVISFIL